MNSTCASKIPPTLRKKFSFYNKAARIIWKLVWLILFRPSPKIFHRWRCSLLRLFGAKIGNPAYVYPSVRIWAPWNLVLGNHATIGEQVDCYCVDKIDIGEFTTVSQYTFLCTASHDYTDSGIHTNPVMPLITSPIIIDSKVWVTAGAFVSPGIHIGEGAVVGARAVVTKNIEPWTVVAGNPAKYIKKRVLKDTSSK